MKKNLLDRTEVKMLELVFYTKALFFFPFFSVTVGIVFNTVRFRPELFSGVISERISANESKSSPLTVDDGVIVLPTIPLHDLLRAYQNKIP